MAERDLVVRFIGDERDLNRAFQNQSRQAKGFQAEVSGLGSTITKSFGRAFLAVGGTTAVFAGLKRSVDSASALNEEIAKSQEVFGAASNEVEKWSETTAASLGIAQTKALEATGVFGNLFRVLEIAPQSAAGMSQALVTLAADLASFNNADPTEVLTALRSGLIGEAEPLRRFGVLLSETRVQQEALVATGKRNVKALTDQEKALARYNIILADTQTAQGDVARTSGSFANQSRQLEAQLNDLSANIGNVLLPTLTSLVTGANQAFDALSRLGKVEVLGTTSGNLAKNFFKWTNPVILQARAVKFALDQVTTAANDAASAVSGAPLRPDDRDGPRGPGGIQAEQDAAAAVAAAKELERAKKRFAAHMKGLGLKLETAGLTKGLSDDRAVLREMERAILRQIQIEGRTFELQQLLIRTRTSLMNLTADTAEQSAADTKAAVDRITKAEKDRRANQRKQFEALGLTATGEERVPGAASLKKRAANLLKQIQGTALDTTKTRSQLQRIAKVLSGQFGKVGKEVRQAILAMLNDISSALNGGSGGRQGPLTTNSGLNTKKVLAGLGLSPEQIRELRSRLSNVTTPGEARTRRSTRTIGTYAGPNGLMVVESHTTINLDGTVVAKVVTRQQQRSGRRNPKQKRGPNRRGGR